jgi:hypothetical protein
LRDFAGKIAQDGPDTPAHTFGGITFDARDGKISAAPHTKKLAEECASILINKPGLYKFKNFSIECIAENDTPVNCRFIIRLLAGRSAALTPTSGFTHSVQDDKGG